MSSRFRATLHETVPPDAIRSAIREACGQATKAAEQCWISGSKDLRAKRIEPLIDRAIRWEHYAETLGKAAALIGQPNDLDKITSLAAHGIALPSPTGSHPGPISHAILLAAGRASLRAWLFLFEHLTSGSDQAPAYLREAERLDCV